VRNNLAVTLLAALAVAGAAVPAMAHHSGAMFEPTKEVTLSGTVKEFQFTNPHSWLLVDVKGPDGKITTWGFEAEGPSSMTRAGIRLRDFTPGTPVTITGHPMKDGRPAALWVKATRTSDNKIFVPARGFAVK
jgi:Family of unknown function (DUF6152)